jgi:hypothetical protein
VPVELPLNQKIAHVVPLRSCAEWRGKVQSTLKWN